MRFGRGFYDIWQMFRGFYEFWWTNLQTCHPPIKLQDLAILNSNREYAINIIDLFFPWINSMNRGVEHVKQYQVCVYVIVDKHIITIHIKQTAFAVCSNWYNRIRQSTSKNNNGTHICKLTHVISITLEIQNYEAYVRNVHVKDLCMNTHTHTRVIVTMSN